jgi:hypothetical protein
VKRNVAPPTDPESVRTSAEQKAQEEDLDREEVWLEADLVIAADGIRSVARRGMLKKLGEEDHSKYRTRLGKTIQSLRNFDLLVEDTGQAAYRILVHREQVLDDPELLELIDGKTSYRWIGEGRHIIASVSLSTVSEDVPPNSYLYYPTVIPHRKQHNIQHVHSPSRYSFYLRAYIDMDIQQRLQGGSTGHFQDILPSSSKAAQACSGRQCA